MLFLIDSRAIVLIGSEHTTNIKDSKNAIHFLLTNFFFILFFFSLFFRVIGSHIGANLYAETTKEQGEFTVVELTS